MNDHWKPISPIEQQKAYELRLKMTAQFVRAAVKLMPEVEHHIYDANLYELVKDLPQVIYIAWTNEGDYSDWLKQRTERPLDESELFNPSSINPKQNG